MYLNEMEPGTSCKVTELNLDPDTAARLQSLGMIPGTQVTILQKKGSGTLILNLRGTRFALGSNMTKQIEVSHDR